VAVDETDKAVTTSGTLTSTDVDNPDNAFTPDSITGTHGNLTIDAHGHWVFTANSAFNQLNVGGKVEETFLVKSIDGTQSTIKVTINGTNDRPTISGTSSGSVIEQGLNTAGTPDATGSLIATDLDKSDTITWAINQPQGQWGTLSIDQHGHWHYQLDNSTGGAADKLAAGEHQSESFWITATDSAGATIPHKIVIDVQGSNDKPIVSAWTQLPAGKEDQPVTIKASDLLTHASDVDGSDVLHVTNLQATHGSLNDNKDGTYTFTPDKDFNGEIRLTYDVVDGHGGSVSTQAKFDLTASPDNAIITDAQTNADLRGVTEDRGYIDTHYQLHYDGRLNIQDPDTGEAHFDPNIGPQTYQGIGYNTKLGGHILLMRDGHYTYTLDNRNIQNLAQGEVKHDSAVIRSADGTTHTIELTVHGTNDAPVINAQSHSVTEDGQLLTGQMQGHDIDHGATLTYSITQAVDGLTFNPDGSYSFDPSHPSYQSLVQGQTQTLTVPVTVTDEHGASATQNLEIMVTGSNDGAQISGTDTGDVYESTYTDRSPDYQRGNISHLWNDHIHTSGKLDIFDSDAGEAHFDNNAPAYQYFGQYGRLILQPDGNWYYHVDVGDSAIGRKIDALNTGENLTDTITIRSADGTTHNVVITIHGDNDTPFASSEVQLNSGKEDNAQTITEAQLLANSMDVDTSDAGKLHVDNLQVDHGSIRDNQDGTYTFTPQKDYNGRVHFTYDVKDAHSGVTHTGATMHLAPVGDAATISGTDSGSITEDRHVFPDSMHHIQVTGSLSISDPDAGEDHFRASGAFGHEKAISDPFQGEMHIDRYGNWDYVLANGNPALQALKQGETKDVIYEVRSADGTPHRITITVTGTNDAPTVSSSVTLAAGKEDTAVTLQASDLLAHASDIDHNAQLSIHNLSADHGQIVDNHDGTFRFIPDKDYNGLVQFSYQVQDEHGASVAQTASMNLAALSDAALITGSGSTLKEDVNLGTAPGDHGMLQAYGRLVVVDPDGPTESGFEDPLTAGSYKGSLGGLLQVNADGQYMYSLGNFRVDYLKDGEVAHDRFTVHSLDGTTHTLEFKIQGTNDAPYIQGHLHHAVWEDEAILHGQLKGVDADAGDQQHLTYSTSAQIAGFHLNADGSYTFDPSDAAYQHLTGRDIWGTAIKIPVTVTDQDGLSTTQSLSISIMGRNDAPVVSTDARLPSGTEDTAVTIHASALLANATDADEYETRSLRVSGLQADHGSVTDNHDGTYTFTPDPNYNGPVQFSYAVQDRNGASTPAHAIMALSAVADSATITGTDIGSVTEDLHPHAPVQGNYAYKLEAHGTLQAIDPDAGESGFEFKTLISAAMHPEWRPYSSSLGGQLAIDPKGNWNYYIDNRKPEIQHLGKGETLTDTVTVHSKDGTTHDIVITIHGTNDAPTVSSEVQLNSGKEDTVQIITASDLLANAVDIDHNDQGQLNIANLIADHGSIRDNQDGTYTFTPEKDYNGEVHFTYDVKDAHSGVTHTGATMHLAPVGDAATITGTDTGSITEDRHVFPDSMHHIQVTGSLSVSDPDAGEDHFRESGAFGHEKAISDPFQGEMHIDRYGNWDYVLASGNPVLQALKQGETKDVIYEVHSADGTPHRITITVTGTNDAPTLAAQTHSVTEDGQRLTGQMQGHDIDHGATLTYSVAQAVDGLTFNPDGSYSFDPSNTAYQHLANGQKQTLTVPVTVTDEHGASATQNLEIVITGTNDAALISGVDTGSVTEGGSQGVMPDLTVSKGAWAGNLWPGSALPPVSDHDPNAGQWYSVQGTGTLEGAAQGLPISNGFWVMNMGNPNYGYGGYMYFTRGTNSATAHFNGVTDDAHGDLHISDSDATPDTFVNVQNQMGDHGYGTFTMKDGHWSFTAGDKATSLPDGAKAQETFTFRTHDGVTHQVTINLTGTDTPSEFKGDFSGNLREGNVGDNAAVHGSISITDPDTNQTPTLPDMPSTSGDNGYGSFTMHNGHWEYTLDQSKVQHVGAKETVQDKITVTASDGTKHDIVVTIQGTNDAPVVNGQTFITPQNGNTPIALSDLLANVRDPDTHDNQHLSVSHLQADHGTITPDGHGGYLYHPENGYKGPVDISYQVTDPEGASVSVHASMGSAPTASSGIIQMHEDSPHTFTAAEFSADNFDQLTISSLPDATHGTLTFNGQPVVAGQHIDPAHIDQLVFTPAHNYHGDANFGFTVSENGLQSAAASGHVTVDSVTDAATIHIQTITDAVMQSGQGHGLAVSHLDGRHLSDGNGQTSMTAEVVVQMQSGSNTNPDAVVLQFGRAAAKGAMTANPVALEEQLGDGSYYGTHHGFSVTNPHNLTLWMPGHMPIQTGIDMTADSGSHRYTFTVDTATHSATVYEDGKEAFHTDAASIWHWIADLHGAYTRSGEWAGDNSVLSGEHFWMDSTPRNPNMQHYPKFIAERMGDNGLNLGDGLHPLGNDKHEIMGSDGQMHAAGGDLSVDAKFTSAVIIQGGVTASQVAAGPLNAQTPGLGDDRVLLDLGVQRGQLVDHTGHQTDALAHHTLNTPQIGGNPFHHNLNLDVQPNDPDDHVTSVKLTGLPDGTTLDDGHGHTATVHDGKAVEVQDWHRSSIGVLLPNTAPTGDVRLHVEVTTTGSDGSTATSTADNTSMHVSDVMTNTAPDIIQSIMLGDEDQTYHFSEQDFGYSDKDGDPLDHITITQLPDLAHGQLLINGHTVTAGQSISVSDIGSLVFQPAHNFNGDVDFQFSVSDGLKDSAPSRGSISIAPVDDAPVLTVDIADTSDNVLNSAEAHAATISGNVDPSVAATLDRIEISDGTNTISVDGSSVNLAKDGDFQVTGVDLSSLQDGTLMVTAHATSFDGTTAMSTDAITKYTPPTISVTVDTINAHHVTAGITASTVQDYARSIGQHATTASGHHEISGHGSSDIIIVQGPLTEEAELKSGNDILYIGGRLTDEEIDGGRGSDTLILGAYNRNNAPRLHSDKIGNMEIESIENIILGDGTILKGHLPPNFPSVGHDYYEVPVNIQAHLSSSDESVSSIRLTHLEQGLTLQSNGHNINANQDGSYTVPANGHLVVISAHPISSGHHYFETEVTTHNSVTGVTAVTTEDLHGHIQSHITPPPPPPPVQHDEPDLSPSDSVQDFPVTLDNSSSTDTPWENHAQVSHERPVGAAAYLDALGIQPNTSPTSGHAQPADMDIVLAQVDQQHAVDYDQTHLDMSDALEHHDAANNHNHNQDDEHHHHNDVNGLPGIDPNN
ncbi:TPA: VCBS domain-containing protein, partial [Vibrio vulnificus]